MRNSQWVDEWRDDIATVECGPVLVRLCRIEWSDSEGCSCWSLFTLPWNLIHTQLCLCLRLSLSFHTLPLNWSLIVSLSFTMVVDVTSLRRPSHGTYFENEARYAHSYYGTRWFCWRIEVHPRRLPGEKFWLGTKCIQIVLFCCDVMTSDHSCCKVSRPSSHHRCCQLL